MKDQADRLRQIIKNLKSKDYSEPADITKPKCKVITVTSGKGGVGKTNISVNLALNLSQKGYRVMILDADFGLANIDILFGISSTYTLLDVLYNGKNILDVMTSGPLNVKFISGGSGIEKMANLSNLERDVLIDKIKYLDNIVDIIIIDTSAGISENVISFIIASDEVILVTTPEPTSIMDAYAVVKVVANRGKNENIKLIVNRAENIKEALNSSDKLCMASQRFLNVKLKKLGYMLYDLNVIKAIKQQQPFILRYPNASITKQLNNITEKLINGGEWTAKKSLGIGEFFRKISNFTKV